MNQLSTAGSYNVRYKNEQAIPLSNSWPSFRFLKQAFLFDLLCYMPNLSCVLKGLVIANCGQNSVNKLQCMIAGVGHFTQEGLTNSGQRRTSNSMIWCLTAEGRPLCEWSENSFTHRYYLRVQHWYMQDRLDHKNQNWAPLLLNATVWPINSADVLLTPTMNEPPREGEAMIIEEGSFSRELICRERWSQPYI